VLLSNVGPNRAYVRKLFFKRRGMTRIPSGVDPKVTCESRLQPAPAEDVAVDDIEGLIPASFGSRGPLHMLRKDASVGYIGEPPPLLERARERKWATGFTADRRIDGERYSHVH
jgi:hypothetical protein